MSHTGPTSTFRVQSVNTGQGDPRLAAEQRARVLIDRQLTDAGWSVQDKRALNLITHQGVACREVVMKAGHGRVDYLLYVDRKVVGVIEAKPEGTTLSGVEWQSAVYANGLPAEVELRSITVEGRLPFVFEASGSETHFTNGYDPQPRSRRIFNVPTPATLAQYIRDAEAAPDTPTWRAKAQHLPPRWTKSPSGQPRSPRSRALSAVWPPSTTTARWCRWPPEPARPTRPSPRHTGC